MQLNMTQRLAFTTTTTNNNNNNNNNLIICLGYLNFSDFIYILYFIYIFANHRLPFCVCYLSGRRC